MTSSATERLAPDPSISIVVEPEPADETRELVLEGLRRYNRQHAEAPGFEHITLAARDGEHRLIGGLAGEIGWRWLHVSLLWVDEAQRGRGIGRALLRAAEQEAARRGCGNVYLDTLAFQALPFYEREGYDTFGVLDGYPPGHRQYYLSKRLERSNAGEKGEGGALADIEVAAICWRRLDEPGHEAAEVQRIPDGWRLHGVVALAIDGRPSALEYTVDCDASWRTSRATIATLLGPFPESLTLERTPGGDWLVDDRPRQDLHDCIDVDLSFTPSTNLLPIRRLELAVGEQAPVRAAWVRLPGFTVEVLEQVYRRTGPATYRYESANGAFRRDLVVDDVGLVVDYPGLWIAERPSTP